MISPWNSSPEAVELAKLVNDNSAYLETAVDDAVAFVLGQAKANKADLQKSANAGKKLAAATVKENARDLENAVGPILAEIGGAVAEGGIRLDMAKNAILLGGQNDGGGIVGDGAKGEMPEAFAADRIGGARQSASGLGLALPAQGNLRALPSGVPATGSPIALGAATGETLGGQGMPPTSSTSQGSIGPVIGGTPVGMTPPPVITLSAGPVNACQPGDCTIWRFEWKPNGPLPPNFLLPIGDPIGDGWYKVATAPVTDNAVVIAYMNWGAVRNVVGECSPCISLGIQDNGGDFGGGSASTGGATAPADCDKEIHSEYGSSGEKKLSFYCDHAPPTGAPCQSIPQPDGSFLVTCDDISSMDLATLWQLAKCGPFRVCSPGGVGGSGDGGGGCGGGPAGGCGGGGGGGGNCCPNVVCPPPVVKIENKAVCPPPIIENKVTVNVAGQTPPETTPEPLKEPCKFEVNPDQPGVFWFDDCYLPLRLNSTAYLGVPEFSGPAPLLSLASDRLRPPRDSTFATFIPSL